MPSAYRDRTGIVFASCFPGLNRIIEHANSGGDDGEGNFDRRYLFQALNMGHSQFAQYTGIRGPNTTLNLACASATAFSIAEDWMTTGRCDRVIILSSDDVTSEHAWDWIGAGFVGPRPRATGNLVEETALPFDRRRNGLILGMGAAAFVLERRSEAEARGVQPIAELLGTQPRTPRPWYEIGRRPCRRERGFLRERHGIEMGVRSSCYRPESRILQPRNLHPCSRRFRTIGGQGAPDDLRCFGG